MTSPRTAEPGTVARRSSANTRRARAWLWLKPILDVSLILVSFVLAYWLRYELQWIRQVEPAYYVPFRVYIPSALALTGILILVYWVEGAYQSSRGHGLFDQVWIVLRGTVIGIATMIVVVFFSTPSYYSRLIFGYSGILIVLLLTGSRVVERVVMARLRRRGIGVQRVLVVGSGETARSVMRAVVARPELGYQIVGFCDDGMDAPSEIGRFPFLGSLSQLDGLLAQGGTGKGGIDAIIVALSPSLSSFPQHTIDAITRRCEYHGVQVYIVPDLFQMTLSRVVVDTLDGIPLLSLREPSLRQWQQALKRGGDIALAALSLVALSPILLLAAIAIRLDSPGKAIFWQTRIGKGGRAFTCFKFRSMHTRAEDQLASLQGQNEASGPWFKMRDDPRCTRVGRFLRRVSLDEVPQLWNVLRGDMSIVGPRPNLPTEVQAYEPWHHRRLEVAPGITGLWQVSGRSDLSFDEMVLLDIYYIENWSPILDLHILLRTVPTVLFGSGAY